MKNSRRRAREFALQAIYQWLVNESSAETLLAQLREQKEFPKADQPLAEVFKISFIAQWIFCCKQPVVQSYFGI